MRVYVGWVTLKLSTVLIIESLSPSLSPHLGAINEIKLPHLSKGPHSIS